MQLRDDILDAERKPYSSGLPSPRLEEDNFVRSTYILSHYRILYRVTYPDPVFVDKILRTRFKDVK